MLARAKLDHQVADVAAPVEQVPAFGHMAVSSNHVQQAPPRRPDVLRRVDHLHDPTGLFEQIQ